MNKIEITVEDYEYHCGDGCCSEHGVDVTYEVNGIEVGRDRLQDFDPTTAESVLIALGYKVDDSYNYVYLEDSYVITAEKVSDLD